MIDVLDSVLDSVVDPGADITRAGPAERTEPRGTATAPRRAPTGWYRRSHLGESLQFWDGGAWRACWLHPLPVSASNKIGPSSAH